MNYPTLRTKENGIIRELRLYGDGTNPDSYKLFSHVVRKGGLRTGAVLRTGIRAIVCYVTEDLSPEKYWEKPVSMDDEDTYMRMLKDAREKDRDMFYRVIERDEQEKRVKVMLKQRKHFADLNK